MKTADFDYDLPPELIAQRPKKKRDEARLLVLMRKSGKIDHLHFRDLPQLLNPGDLLVINDARVLPCRLDVRKPTGAKIEITLIGIVDGEKNIWRALIKPSRRIKAGQPLKVGEELEITPQYKSESGIWRVELVAGGSVTEVLERVGRAPLPPYIKRKDEDPREEDIERYQTVYADKWIKPLVSHAVAAPTAGLHFTNELLRQIEKAGVGIAKVRLDVGWGSFAPVRAETVEEHEVETEKFRVSSDCSRMVNSTRSEGGRVIAVGTTSVRALESAWKGGSLEATDGSTGLFITPGYKFRAVDAMITNFHLPRSSLIMLVAAFAGLDNILNTYREAIRRKYRFYSYGDAMFIF